MSDEILHYGLGHDDSPPGRGSGRYAYGSGDNPFQHQFNFVSEAKRMQKKGMTQRQIAEVLLGPHKTSTDLRAALTIAKAAERKYKVSRAIELYDELGNYSAVGRKMGINESSVRKLLDPVLSERRDRYQNTADMIAKVVDEKKFVDVGVGTEILLGVTKNTKDTALSILEQEGYTLATVKVPQVGTGKETNVLVIAPPGTTWAEVQKNKLNVKPIQEFTPDTGKTWWTPEYPESIDSKRVLIKYNEEGGVLKDGVVEIRPGVEDLSLGDSRYAQVRIAVDGTHYMKGMAIYSDEIPEGYDIIYNTNKKVGTDPKDVFKKMKVNETTGEIDKENPFGATIKAGGQRHYIGEDGQDHLSPINKLQEEGDWDKWSRTIASQFLSKQSEKLISQQLGLSLDDKKFELEEIQKLTNPAIKKKLLTEFADQCDANAADLSAKGFKNQSYQVLLPIPELKDTEIYAPNYQNGDQVALVRFPHGGVFEIPLLTVNNKNPKARKVIGNGKDAVGINQNVAEILSGADFDGDTAIVIPVKSNKIDIISAPPLEELKGFDGKALYKLKDESKVIKSRTKQTEMGKVTNLITDMTVGDAEFSDIAKAVKHSMVVIDSEKHKLDYKQSEKDNDIRNLKVRYQGVNPVTGNVRGASTILSRASSEMQADERKELTDTKKMTPEQLERYNAGYKVYIPTGKTGRKQITNVNKMTPEELERHNAGFKVYRDTGVQKQVSYTTMDLYDDAMDLVRDPSNKKEVLYANYANGLKEIGRAARKEAREITPEKVNASAAKTYAEEVKTLKVKLRVAKSNAPRERQAQTIANERSMIIFKDNPSLDNEHKQRIRNQQLVKARAEVGSGKEMIKITDREWDAIQAKALTTSTVTEILNNTNPDEFRKRATPRSNSNSLSSVQLNLIKSMYASGMYTQSEIAERVGVSVSTVNNAL